MCPHLWGGAGRTHPGGAVALRLFGLGFVAVIASAGTTSWRL